MKYAPLLPRLPLAVAASAVLASLCFAANADADPVNLLSSDSVWYRKSNGFAGAPAGNGTVAGNKLTYSPTNANGEMLSYFAPQGSPVALGVGQQITLNFSYSINTPLSGAGLFRIGLFDSNDVTRVSSNDFAAANANGYTGYFISTGPSGTGSTASRLYARGDSSAGNMISGTGNAFPSAGDAGGYIHAGSGYGLQNNTAYNGFLRIAYISSDVVEITYSFNDAAESITWLDSAAKYTSFDTVGIMMGKNSSDATPVLTMTGLSYEITQIPEPATVSALAGLLCLGVVAVVRRRRAAQPVA